MWCLPWKLNRKWSLISQCLHLHLQHSFKLGNLSPLIQILGSPKLMMYFDISLAVVITTTDLFSKTMCWVRYVSWLAAWSVDILFAFHLFLLYNKMSKMQTSHLFLCDLRCFWSLSLVSWARPSLNRSWSPWLGLTRGIWTVCIGWASCLASQTGWKTTRRNWIHYTARTSAPTWHRWNSSRWEKHWLTALKSEKFYHTNKQIPYTRKCCAYILYMVFLHFSLTVVKAAAFSFHLSWTDRPWTFTLLC